MPRPLFTGCFVVLLICISSRHLLFQRYLTAQKSKFRSELFKFNTPEIFTICIKTAHLYKDLGGLEWKDHNKELVYLGRFHEVLHIDIKDGNAYIHLIEDRFENKLVSSFYKTLSTEDTAYTLLSELLQLKFIGIPFRFNLQVCVQCVNTPISEDSGVCTQFPSRVFVPPKA